MKYITSMVVVVLAAVIAGYADDKTVEKRPGSSQSIRIRDEFKKLKKDSILSIRESAGDGWVQISLLDDSKAAFQVLYPTNGNPVAVFSAAGMTIPET